MSDPAPGSQLIACSNRSTSVPKDKQRTGDSCASRSAGVGVESQLNLTRRHSRARCQRADVAQMAEQLTCNQQVAGSIPAVGSPRERNGESGSAGVERGRAVVARAWCLCLCGSSSVGRASAFQAERRGFDSRLPLSSARADGMRETLAKTSSVPQIGTSTVMRDGAVLPERRRSEERARGEMGYDRRFRAQVAQSAEHVLGKDEVGGSIPLLGLLNGEDREPVQSGCEARVGEERYPSGQREQTVNLPAYAFGGSNPPLSMRKKTATGYRLRREEPGVLAGRRQPVAGRPEGRGAGRS